MANGSPRTDIDREAIATSAALIGIRPTSRKLGVSVAMVQRIVKAAGVSVPDPLLRQPERITAVRTVQTDTAMQPSHVQVTDELTRLGGESRLATAQLGAKALPYLARRSARAILSQVSPAELVKMQANANIPGYERQQDRPSIGVVNIALLGLDLPSADLQSATIQ